MCSHADSYEYYSGLIPRIVSKRPTRSSIAALEQLVADSEQSLEHIAQLFRNRKPGSSSTSPRRRRSMSRRSSKSRSRSRSRSGSVTAALSASARASLSRPLTTESLQLQALVASTAITTTPTPQPHAGAGAGAPDSALTERSETVVSLSQIPVCDAGSSFSSTASPRESVIAGRVGGGMGVRAGLMSVRSTCLNGSTLLHTAALFGQETLVIRVLLMLSSALELRFRGCGDESLLHPLLVTDFHRATPLHRCRQPHVMRALLDFRTDYRAQDSEGNTLLHLFVSTDSFAPETAATAAADSTSSGPEAAAKLSRPTCLSARLRPSALSLLSDDVTGELDAELPADADESPEQSDRRALERLRERDANLRHCMRIVLELEKSELSRTRHQSAAAGARNGESGGGGDDDGEEQRLALVRNSLFFTPAHCAALKGRVDLLDELLTQMPDLPEHLNSEPRYVQPQPAARLGPSSAASQPQQPSLSPLEQLMSEAASSSVGPDARRHKKRESSSGGDKKKKEQEHASASGAGAGAGSATRSVMYLAFVNNHVPAARWLLQHGFTFHAREPEFLLEALLTSRLILYDTTRYDSMTVYSAHVM